LINLINQETKIPLHAIKIRHVLIY